MTAKNLAAVGGLVAICVVIGSGVVAQEAWTLVVAVTVLGVVLMRATGRRFALHAPQEHAAVVWPALLLPTVLAMRSVTSPSNVIFGLGILVVVAALHRRLDQRRSIPLGWVVLVALTFAGSLLRPADQFAPIVAVLTLWVLYLIATRFDPRDATASLVDGVGLYLIVNVVGYYALGLRSAAAGTRLASGLEASSGGERIFYPFATALSQPSALAAIFLSAAVIFFDQAGARRLYRGLCGVAAVIVLVTVDNRAALIATIGITATSLLRPYLLRRAAVPVAVVAVIFAFVFPILARPVVAPTINLLNDVASVERVGESSAASLNGREFIFRRAVQFWGTHAAPSPQTALFGYGTFGQETSGASSTFSSLFEGGFRDPRKVSTHNSALQQLYDAGYLGLLAFSVLVLLGVRRWSRRSSEPYVAFGLAAILSALVGGMTEVSIAPGYGQESMWVFLGFVLVGASRRIAPQGTSSAVAPSRGAARVLTRVPALDEERDGSR